MSERLASVLRIAAAGYESILFNGTDPDQLREALDGVTTRGTRVPSVAPGV